MHFPKTWMAISDFVQKVVGMEEGESDYSVVHLGPETQGLPAFHRIVGEDEVIVFETPPKLPFLTLHNMNVLLVCLCLMKANA